MGHNPELLRVDLEPTGRRAEIRTGCSLLDATQSAGIELVALCGGAGTCGTCRVRLVDGASSPPTLDERATLSAEELAAGDRLACQTIPLSDAKLNIPPESLTAPQRLLVEGLDTAIPPDAVVVAIDVTLPPADLKDQRADSDRLLATLAEQGVATASIAYPVLRDFSRRLREQGWSARIAVRGGEIVAVLAPATPLLGLAVDVGTTKIAAYLVELETGATLAKAGEMNPQVAYGEDVISRIQYTNREADGRHVLQALLVDTLNRLLRVLCTEAGVDSERVVEAVVVGNTVMHHLCAGLPVEQLGLAPYVPAVGGAMNIPARDLDLAIAAGAYVHFPANIAGYVGADHLSALLAMEMWKTRRTTLLVDIGTNTEITLVYSGRLRSCSCASGPAFEGAHISDGMRAAPGAIERLQMLEGRTLLRTIGGKPPVGLCGSGILDAVAAMRKAGVIDRSGRIQPSVSGVRLQDGQLEFVLVPASETGHGRDIVVRRGDINEVQLAKAAIRAGLEILLADAGLTSADVDEFIVAGAFGTYLEIASAVEIGMFPGLPGDRFRQVGNAAGMGAKQILISAERRQIAAEIARRVEPIELTTHPDFTERFMEAIPFGPPEAIRCG
jgi:uncharacterized 2Fe-2S/4Fe-4S cluster protein (DUF4445 family)